MFLKAQNPEDGYYRVHNLGSERYVYITDNTGSINYQAMTADFGALQLWKNQSRTVSDPASVVYLKKMGVDSGGPYYNLQSQGTGIYEIIKKTFICTTRTDHINFMLRESICVTMRLPILTEDIWE